MSLLKEILENIKNYKTLEDKLDFLDKNIEGKIVFFY